MVGISLPGPLEEILLVEANSAKNPAGRISEVYLQDNEKIFTAISSVNKSVCSDQLQKLGKLQEDYIEWCCEQDYSAAP